MCDVQSLASLMALHRKSSILNSHPILSLLSIVLLVTTLMLVWHTAKTTTGTERTISTQKARKEIPDFSNHGLLQSLAVRNAKQKRPPGLALMESQPKDTQQAKNPQAQDSNHPEYLGDDDIQRWRTCTYLAGRVKQNASVSHQCHFLNRPQQDPVGLASLPGSGNTWVRGLLETATGICTGAVYCDISLRAKGFIGEHVRSGHVIAVKTHAISPRWGRASRLKVGKLSENVGIFGSAILLVRNPFDALVAEWNRKVANKFRVRTTELDSHTKAAGPEWFGKNSMWDEYVQEAMNRWQNTIRHWFIFNDQHPVLVVKYESLKKNTMYEVQRMLDFLGIEYEADEVEKRLRTGFDTFRRKHSQEEFDHFTVEQRVLVNEGVKVVGTLLAFNGKSHLLDVSQYISNANSANGSSWHE